VVVATGTPDVVTIGGFVTVGCDDTGGRPALRCGGVAAPRAAADVVAGCVVVTVDGGTPALRSIAVCVFVTGGAILGFVALTDAAGAGVAAWRFCHQFQPP
jgi:hypothetical protein